MPKFEANAIIVRELENLTIIFWDADSIYVYPNPRETWGGVIFHKWYVKRGFYRESWKDFRRQMLRQKHLTLLHCHVLANRYEISHVTTKRVLDLTNVNTERRT